MNITDLFYCCFESFKSLRYITKISSLEKRALNQGTELRGEKGEYYWNFKYWYHDVISIMMRTI